VTGTHVTSSLELLIACYDLLPSDEKTPICGVEGKVKEMNWF